MGQGRIRIAAEYFHRIKIKTLLPVKKENPPDLADES
jgi:hypothetical protein